ncbi:DAK2 domain-containing protein [Pseudactinotalea sp. HY160]|uniref:dihydroxyacetone kinase family protein n=1 Tax=Pseudactinotalea sp. HY160 TaxID=2654490 RepID=UPI00128E1398|nr:dihydroxyacetone kinase family protein [Pseudactinotalea sp. HY160]MPV49169.1 DAK2 domain-containing protein [Pseudactinotalea sp. HY160]
MTKIHNDPATFTEDAMRGFCMVNERYVRAVRGGVVRRSPGPDGKVAVLVGGGTGHYPAFAGWVGPGFADGAVVGNIFSAPSAQYAQSVARASERGGGVIFAYGNHAGDVMNFGMATQALLDAGVDARQVVVTDDIHAAGTDEISRRRGIAGDFTVFKVLGAAAETGAPIDEVERLGNLANNRTRTVGIGLSGCTMPGKAEPLFTVEAGTMAIGLGLHGEPGITTVELGTAADIAHHLVEPLLAEDPGDDRRIAVVLNGLGTTKYEELFLLWAEIAPLLTAAGYDLVEPEVGEIVTSLDMGGVSLTITWLNDELEPLWRAACDTPAWRRGTTVASASAQTPTPASVEDGAGAEEAADVVEIPEATAASLEHARSAVRAAEKALAAIRANEAELGRLDAVAGDGDHGRGMTRGVSAACVGAREAAGAGAGLGTTIARAGEAWADAAGGTSGVLWGSALGAAGRRLGDGDVDPARVAAAVEEFVGTIGGLGGARVGDKTMLDAMAPFSASLGAEIGSGPGAAEAAVRAAEAAAQATADLEPRIGRARPNAGRSRGAPDPGAVSFALIARAVVASLAAEDERC